MTLTLTEHQENALVQLLDLPGQVVALRGLAGTGKTSIIPAIARAMGEVTVSAPTNRAAGVLRQKGLEAVTLHKACLRPYYTEEFETFSSWVQNPNSQRMPPLLKKVSPEEAILKVNQCSNNLEKACIAFNVHPMDYVQGWAARDQDPQPCLIIDEASMVGERMLAEAMKVFDRIILVGDPGQLRPIKDTSVLETSKGIEITEIHRQAQDSPIVQFAHAIRHARPGSPIDPPEGIEIAGSFDIGKGPVIVYTNKTRRSLNTGMRRKAGYPEHELVPEEPLVCKATSKDWAQQGLVNNSLWTYKGEGFIESETGEKIFVDKMHVEGISKGEPHFLDCQFQPGYAITAHTAQGSEWPSIQIYVNEVTAFEKTNGREEAQKWLYTAVTRAREKLTLVYA